MTQVCTLGIKLTAAVGWGLWYELKNVRHMYDENMIMDEKSIRLFFYERALNHIGANSYLDPFANEDFIRHAIDAAEQSVRENGGKPYRRMCNIPACDMCNFWMEASPLNEKPCFDFMALVRSKSFIRDHKWF